MARLYEGCVLIQLVSLSALLGMVFMKNPDGLLSFSVARILSGEVYRLFFSSFIFGDMGQTFYGLILLYSCRQFERLMGLRKFGAFAMFSYLTSIILHLCMTTIINLSMDKEYTPASGPYFLVYSLLVLYHKHIPRLHASQYTLLGTIVFSEKTWIYLLAIHLALCTGFKSMVSAVVGILIGLLYTRVTALQSWRLPVLVERGLGFFGSFFASLVPATAERPRAANARGPGALNPTAPPSAQPSEEAITLLMTSLGVGRDAAIRALEMNGNSVEAAANFLLR